MADHCTACVPARIDRFVGWSWFREKLSPLSVNKCYHGEQILWRIATCELGPRSYCNFVKNSRSLAPCTHHITSGIWWKIQHVYWRINIHFRVSLFVFVFIFVIACIRGTPNNNHSKEFNCWLQASNNWQEFSHEQTAAILLADSQFITRTEKTRIHGTGSRRRKCTQRCTTDIYATRASRFHGPIFIKRS